MKTASIKGQHREPVLPQALGWYSFIQGLSVTEQITVQWHVYIQPEMPEGGVFEKNPCVKYVYKAECA